MMSISVKVMVQKVQIILAFGSYSLNQEGFDVSISPTYTGTVCTTEEYCVRVVHPVVFM